MKIRKVDLNLFRTFEAILRHRSVSGASRELGVTASAVSHALARLRRALDDELFVATDAGMAPTPRALALAPAIRDGLGRIDLALDAQAFDPARAVRTFRLAASDYVAVTVLPPVIGRLSGSAPHLDLRVFPFNRMDAVRHLDDGWLDAAIGWFSTLPGRMRRATVHEETEAVVVRAGHPLAAGAVTFERLCAFPHAVVDLTGTEEEAVGGFVDDRGVWRRTWVERLLLEMGADDGAAVGRVAVTVPHYAAVLPLLAVSNMVATLPRSFAGAAVAAGTHCFVDLPYPPLAVAIEVIWHERADRDPAIRWLVDQVTAAMRGAATAAAGAGTPPRPA